jgi:EAL domain-containing protein (putative c-di-GMP-specific phosphodiesterase class I)
MTGTDIVVLFSSSCSILRAQQVLEQIIMTIRVPVEIDGTSFTVSATCGAACFPKDSADRDELIMKANLALYDAKSNKVPVSFFNERISRKLLLRTQIRNLMPQALVNHEFELYYQPKMQAYENRILGFEALLRWHSPDLGELAPLDFIGVAEESGLILPLGAGVLRSACRALKMLNELYQKNFFMAVNVSGIQLLTPDFYDEVIDAINEAGLKPGELELEVTESVLLNQEISAVETLNCLNDRGVKIALDDFGTGWSSMSLLKDLKISTLKIDKSFVQDPQAAKLTELMVQMGHLLGVEIVAEGVETASQLEFVKKIGCDRVQGYYFAKPMPLGALKSFIQTIGN